jgi:hypothetical protein
MEAFPHMSTIDHFVTNEADKYPQSHVLDFHNKADGHERRIATYLVENLRTATDLEVSIYARYWRLRMLTEEDLYLPYTSRPSRNDDVWLPRMAPPVGR